MEAKWMADDGKADREGKDSVFADLFHILRYTRKLVKALHPRLAVTETDIEIISLHSVLLHRPYNDLGLLVKDRLLIIVEAQSTWSVNVLVRILLYLAMTYHNYIREHKLYLYGSKKITLPRPECYVIYTGQRKNRPAELSLSKEFFGGNDALDLRVKVLSSPDTGNIIGEYIQFCRVFDSQREKHGQTRRAVEETIRICRARNVLKEYLEERMEEVKTIMMTLFSQEEAMESYGHERERKGRAEGRAEGQLDAIRKLMQNMRLTALDAMNVLSIPQDEQKKLQPLI